MKEIKLKIGGLWGCVTAILITAMLCGTAIFVSMQHNDTQRALVDTQSKAMKESADKINSGLDSLGKGTCQSSSRQNVFCSGY